MVEKSDKQKKAEELAQELFTGMKPEEMPSADTLLSFGNSKRGQSAVEPECSEALSGQVGEVDR